jgi:ATP-binding cassette subfamily B protein
MRKTENSKQIEPISAPSGLFMFSFLWKSIRPYWFYYVLMLLAPTVSAFYPFIYNYAIKLFLDTMVKDHLFTFRDIVYPLCLFLGMEVLVECSWRLGNVAEWRSEPYVRKNILVRAYNHIQHLRYTFFQENISGLVTSKVKGILEGYNDFWGEMHHGVFQSIFSALVSVLVLFSVSSTLGIFMVIWTFVFVTAVTFPCKRIIALSYQATEGQYRVLGGIADRISNMTNVFSFARGAFELKALKSQTDIDFIPRQIKLYWYLFWLQIIMSLLYLLMLCSVTYLMIVFRQKQLISLGDFTFVFGMIFFLSEKIWQITFKLLDFVRQMGDFKSALSIMLSSPTEPESSKSTPPLCIARPYIQFKNISFRYAEEDVFLNHFNLKIQAGEKIGVVGYSGAGKSTLVSLLMRYFSPQKGKIFIDNQDISKVSVTSLREHIALIPQIPSLFNRTLEENILYGDPEASRDAFQRACKLAHVDSFARKMPHKYKTVVGERGAKISGGQVQRIAIARAILKNAPIVILDEATSSLDSITEQEIQESIDQIFDDKAKTVIVIAHRLSTVMRMDRIIVLDQGCIVEEGTHASLLQKKDGAYAKLWASQSI